MEIYLLWWKYLVQLNTLLLGAFSSEEKAKQAGVAFIQRYDYWKSHTIYINKAQVDHITKDLYHYQDYYCYYDTISNTWLLRKEKENLPF